MTTAELSDLPATAGVPPHPTCAEIYEAHFEFVWRNARRLGIAESNCEDVVQEVFLVALRKLAAFEGRSSIRTWLYAILCRVAAEHRRRDRQRSVKESAAASEATSTTDAGVLEALARKEATALVDGILAEMDEDKRTVFVLVDLEEVSVADAARGLGVNLNTVHARLRAARGAFAEAVKRIHAQRSHGEAASRFWWRRS